MVNEIKENIQDITNLEIIVHTICIYIYGV